jgi:hypothetical protein
LLEFVFGKIVVNPYMGRLRLRANAQKLSLDLA